MTYFISYDVANPKRLCKVSKVLENFGIRIQYSFFECEMEKKVLIDLRDKLLSVLNLKEDSLRIYPLCEDCLKKNNFNWKWKYFYSQKLFSFVNWRRN